MKNALLSLSAVFFGVIITLGTPTLRAADSGEHPFSILYAIHNHATGSSQYEADTPKLEGFATTVGMEELSVPHNEYINNDKEFSELPKYLRPNQINEISRRYGFRFPREEPLIFAHDWHGNLYLREVIDFGFTATCYAIKPSGTISRSQQTKDQRKLDEYLCNIDGHKDFLIVHLISLHIKNLLRKAPCFLKASDTTYRLDTKHALPKQGEKTTHKDNPIIATFVSGDRKPDTYLAHILLAQGKKLENKLESKVIDFYTLGCMGWRQSKNAALLTLIYNAAEANQEN